MSKTIEMLVGLKIPDTTAITALRTLRNMGLTGIISVVRENYYKFHVEGDEGRFRKEISKADILVNANKNYFAFEKDSHSKKANLFRILVKDTENGAGLAGTLGSLGFAGIKKIEKGVLWTLEIENDKKEIAKRAAEELLHNEHYQSYEIIT